MTWRTFGPALTLGLVLAGGIAWIVAQRGPVWTTVSPQALEEYQGCLDAAMKLYTLDARTHCEKALDLDPSFVAAKLTLARQLRYTDPERSKALYEELRGTDLERLSPRERLLVRYTLARLDGRGDDASRQLATYLDRQPDDPFVLDLHCGELWEAQEWSAAEACFRHLLEVDPNWVQAQNHLGYIAMAQGHFAEAESQFRTYRFVAPDQANPHDSLGELLTIVGRYDEAWTELEKAVEIRPDFCASYEHMISLAQLAGQPERVQEALAGLEAQPACDPKMARQLSCRTAVWRAMLSGWEEAWAAFENGCNEGWGEALVLGHSAAVSTGRLEEARALEAKVREVLSRPEGLKPQERGVMTAILHHMEGMRRAVGGDEEGAIRALREADQHMRYWNDTGLGIFKLFNRLQLADLLREAGRGEEAATVVAEIRAVNPRFVDTWGDAPDTASP